VVAKVYLLEATFLFYSLFSLTYLVYLVIDNPAENLVFKCKSAIGACFLFPFPLTSQLHNGEIVRRAKNELMTVITSHIVVLFTVLMKALLRFLAPYTHTSAPCCLISDFMLAVKMEFQVCYLVYSIVVFTSFFSLPTLTTFALLWFASWLMFSYVWTGLDFFVFLTKERTLLLEHWEEAVVGSDGQSMPTGLSVSQASMVGTTFRYRRPVMCSKTSDNENVIDTTIPQCVVCLEEFADEDDITILPCCHQYHASCIRQWLLNRNNCPCCRAPAATTIIPANTPTSLSRTLIDLDENDLQEEGEDSSNEDGIDDEELVENSLLRFLGSRTNLVL